MPAPVILLSFNRPAYLRPVLESLAGQHDGLKNREIHLLQDGAVNRYSGIRYADDADISACVALFRDVFPRGHVHLSSSNIGICESFQRAHRLAFRELGAPVAYFFEDDMVLGRWYVETLDRIWDQVSERPLIGYFAAYGRHDTSIEEQRRYGGRMVPLVHLWGYGLSRRHWEDMQPLLEPYFELVTGRDYRQRNNRDISMLQIRDGAYCGLTSQDAAGLCATARLGRWSAMTAACQGKYIGAVGTHFTEQVFRSFNFQATNLFDCRIPELDLPDDFTIRSHVEERQAASRTLASVMARTYEGLALAGEAAKCDVDRLERDILPATIAPLQSELAMLRLRADALRQEIEALPGRRVWRGLLPIRRRVAQLRGRIAS